MTDKTTLDAIGAFCLKRAHAWQSLGDPWMRAISDNSDDWALQADLLERGMRLRAQCDKWKRIYNLLVPGVYQEHTMPNETTALQVAAAPCKSCPYRCDVPSGVWAREEYDKLPLYDGEMAEQAMRGAFAMFYCHQKDGRLCAGWVGAHGADNLLAMRLNAERLDRAVWGYRSPLSVFGSGREASAHGKRSIRRPKADAQRIIRRLSRKMAATP